MDFQRQTPEPKIKESARSEELRDELRKQGYRIRWDVKENLTRVSYWNSGAGKAILVLEHAHDENGSYQWASWDIYRQLTTENNIAKTYAALGKFTQQEVGA